MHVENSQIRPVPRRVNAQARRRTARVHYAANPAGAPIKRTIRKVPLRYVVIGVTLYCAVAWSIVVVGVNAGMKALQKQPTSYAASSTQTNR